MTKHLESVEGINKKLEKLDIMEKELRDMNEHMLKKGDVDKMIKKHLIPMKRALTKHEVRMNRQQTDMEEVKKKMANCMNEINQCVDDWKDNDTTNTALGKKDVEEMIKKASEDKRKGEIDNKTERNKANKNLICHGMVEDNNVEDLSKVQDVAHEIRIRLHRWDVDKTSRIGAYEKGKKRLVKVELVSEITKHNLLKSKHKLKASDLYTDIQVVPDETKHVRQAKALLRQAAYLATKRGDRVWK